MLQESLPNYNPSAVFIFDKNGDIVYKNEPGTEYFEEISVLNDFKIDSIESLLSKDINTKFYYKFNKKHYQLDVVSVKILESVFIYTSDITNVIKLSEKVKQNEKELLEQAKAAEMGHMIGAISHQLKQPLSVIRILVDNIKLSEELNLVVDLDDTYEKIIKQVDFSTDTIDLFRNFLNTNQQKENVYLNKVVNDTLLVTINALPDINIVKDYQELSSTVSVLPNELIQACMNILKNASDIQNEKDIKDKIIKISVYEEDQYQIISIIDNAGGVPDDIIDLIFDQYFSTKSKIDGTGIGLNLVKKIVENNHDGLLEVVNKSFTYEEKEYFGACFLLKFKLTKIN